MDEYLSRMMWAFPLWLIGALAAHGDLVVGLTFILFGWAVLLVPNPFQRWRGK